MNREQEIRLIAYQIWESEGCPRGCELEHWLKAEVLWEQRRSQTACAPQSNPQEPVAAATPKKRSRKSASIRKK